MGLERIKIFVEGIVQGVGFRPFVYRQATKENLKGCVANTSHGVEIEVEGEPEALDRFVHNLQSQAPVLARITNVRVTEIPPSGDAEFLIRSSREDAVRSTLISPDMAVCNDCLNELFDPQNRRYRYPFINCTHCGPRYTIIQDIPYDRPRTTMRCFSMCPECEKEYRDPSNRRFHAQPNACPVCGPRVWLTDKTGEVLACDDPITEAARWLHEGKIVAVKGLGGFHLACDATSEDAVTRLRRRKGREEKPLAVMAPDLKAVETFAEISAKEKDMLLSPRRPIVLLVKKRPSLLAESVAPRNKYMGTMLPYSPLHYLLLEGFRALVMTSGNLSEEPIAIGNREALERLGEIADVFLMHNRDIYLRSDDSVTRFMGGLPRPVRRSRGYVPVPVFLRKKMPSLLAVGGELKNTICLTKEDQAFLSQHVGDMENFETLHFFQECVDHLRRILKIEPVAIAHDLHPDYLATQWALEQKGIPHIGVQHHHAHIAACLAENGRDDRVIGLSLDGTGYGDDGTIWGGEVLVADLASFQRVGHIAYHSMPGGSAAIQEPWRMAVAYLYEVYRDDPETNKGERYFFRWIEKMPFVKTIGPKKIRTVVRMLQGNFRTPQTSSLGRLFDGVAAMIGLREKAAFEGQAAMELEMGMENGREEGYSIALCEKEGKIVIVPDAMIRQIRTDVLRGIPVGKISYLFHAAWIRLFVQVSKMIRDRLGIRSVALSGGCFQNRFLLENLCSELEKEGFEVLTHSQIPSNDGGLALGQAVVASYRLA